MNSKENRVIKLKDLSSSIYKKNIVNKKDEAERLANTVMNFFGYSDEVIDNLLNQEERNVFYILQDNDLLFSREEEYSLIDGKKWRVNYWVLNRTEIFSTLKEDKLSNIIEKMNDEESEEFKKVFKNIEDGYNSKEALEFLYGEKINNYLDILENNNIIELEEKEYNLYKVINKDKIRAIC